jgi:hypothetical protein
VDWKALGEKFVSVFGGQLIYPSISFLENEEGYYAYSSIVGGSLHL